MITIQSGKMLIPENERFVGFAGDNQTTTRQFFLPGGSDQGRTFTLYLKFDDGSVTSAPLSAHSADGGLILVWNVLARHLLKSGIVMAQLKITDVSGQITHIGWDYFITAESAEHADDGSEIDILHRSEFEERMGQTVSKDQRIAGITLADDITTAQLKNALSVPDRTSQLVNDSGFLTDAAVADKMGLSTDIPFDSTNDRPDTETAAFNALPLGQVFSSQESFIHPRYWVKYRVPNSSTYSARELITTHQDVSAFLTAEDIVGKMDLNVNVPFDSANNRPDTETAAFNALPLGQVFSSQANAVNPRYWVKYRVPNSNIYSARELITTHQDVSEKMDLPPTIASPYSGMFNNLPQGQLYCNTQGKYFIKDAYYGSGGDGKVQLLTEHQNISGKVDKTTTIAGISLQSDILTASLKDALDVPFVGGYNSIADFESAMRSGDIKQGQAVAIRDSSFYRFYIVSQLSMDDTGDVPVWTYTLTEYGRTPDIYFGTTDKSAVETGDDVRRYQKFDRYINTTSGKVWVCESSEVVGQSWQYAWSYKGVCVDISGKENTANKVTTITAASTNTQFPSALAVKNYVDAALGDIESALASL